jgi:hypothetical protein
MIDAERKWAEAACTHDKIADHPRRGLPGHIPRGTTLHKTRRGL